LIVDPDHSGDEDRFPLLGSTRQATAQEEEEKNTIFRSPARIRITIRLDTAAVSYFKQMAAELGMPYQNLINHHRR